MSDDEVEQPAIEVRKLYLRRSARSGAFVPTRAPPASVSPDDNLVLRQLKSMREENKVMLERQIRDQQLIVRLAERMEAGFDNVRSDIRQLREDVKEIRSDLVSLENKLLNGQNAVLDIVRRLDDAESAFEVYEVTPDLSDPLIQS